MDGATATAPNQLGFRANGRVIRSHYPDPTLEAARLRVEKAEDAMYADIFRFEQNREELVAARVAYMNLLASLVVRGPVSLTD
jgi:hypothetical protein